MGYDRNICLAAEIESPMGTLLPACPVAFQSNQVQVVCGQILQTCMGMDLADCIGSHCVPPSPCESTPLPC